jgi:hypothetical protein
MLWYYFAPGFKGNGVCGHSNLPAYKENEFELHKPAAKFFRNYLKEFNQRKGTPDKHHSGGN